MGRSNKFGQKQELTNNDYSEIIIAYPILNMTTLNYILIKKKNNYMPDPRLAGAASLSFQYGRSVNKANVLVELFN